MDTSTPDHDSRDLDKMLSERDDEIRRLRLALDVLSPIDPSSGTLNRNGILDAITDSLNWLARRKDCFAILLIEIGGLGELHSRAVDEHRRLHQHLEAALGASLRGVDKIGHLDHMTYATVLTEFKKYGSEVVLNRMRNILRLESERVDSSIEPAFTLAVVNAGTPYQSGQLLEQVESQRGRATVEQPHIIDL